jgi:hypothetical protein
VIHPSVSPTLKVERSGLCSHHLDLTFRRCVASFPQAVTNRLMGQADATVVGYDAAGTAAYATDYYLGSYVECHNPDASGAGVDGVCEDASHGGGAALDNVEVRPPLCAELRGVI